MLKYTKHTLKKIEELFKKIEYVIRYEKGNFQSGYCIVENKRIAVINKFFDPEARINSLIDILGTIEVDTADFSDKELSFYNQLSELFNIKNNIQTEEEEEIAIENEEEKIGSEEE